MAARRREPKSKRRRLQGFLISFHFSPDCRELSWTGLPIGPGLWAEGVFSESQQRRLQRQIGDSRDDSLRARPRRRIGRPLRRSRQQTRVVRRQRRRALALDDSTYAAPAEMRVDPVDDCLRHMLNVQAETRLHPQN